MSNRSMYEVGRRGTTVMLAVLSFGSAIAWAQGSLPGVNVGPPPGEVAPAVNVPPGETITAPNEIAYCLCQQQALTSTHDALTEAQSRYDAQQARLTQLKDEVALARGRVAPGDVGALDAYRRLLLAEEQQKSEFFHVTVVNDEAAAQRYNQAVSSYNQNCAGRGWSPQTVAAVRPGLVCPVPRASYAPPP